MDSVAIVAALQEALPGVDVESGATRDQHPTIWVGASHLLEVARALRSRLGFELLAELTAIDVHPREPRFEVVYILVSIANRRRLRMKTRLAGAAARLPTVSGIWPAANWLEREVWDLFGIEFEDHPDPRRLLMPDDWDGHPLRKDYPVQIKMPAHAGEPLQVTEEEFRQNLEKDRLTRQR